MTPVRVMKKSTRYRYYVSRNMTSGIVADNPGGQRLPAPDIEALIVRRLKSLFANPVELLNALPKDRYSAPIQKRFRDAAAAISARWDVLSSEALYDLLRAVIVRVQVLADQIVLDVDSA